ncbi:MAG: hypothetical protein ACI4WS_11910 [Oscillospiraceae bacterium]
MTVSKIRELMQERVIPESVLPQNIAAYLSDGEYLPPELDAFTFLNRLRSLGIGSADFLYLLKGCGAPEEAVEKIEQRPDMNLQSLIMTLHDSGLTSKDYTRMLYTARQLWEHTITMRLDLEAEEQSEQPDTERPAPEPAAPAEKPAAIKTARQKRSESEFREYTGVKPIGKHSQPDESADSGEAPTVISSETSTFTKVSPDYRIDDEPKQPAARVKTARQKKKTETEFREYVGVKPIGKRDLPDEPTDTDEVTGGNTGTYTAIQLKARPETDEEQYAATAEDSPAGRRGAVIAASAGAVVLCALSAGVDLLGFSQPASGAVGAHFAEDSSEIFAEISTAYHAEKIGGGNVQPMTGGEQVFGELLISSTGGLGTFSAGDTVLAADSDVITMYSLSGGEAELTAEILPPQGAEFLTVYQTESGIAAVYSGENSCGVTSVDGTGQSCLTEQCGRLTDYWYDGVNIRLGSVYTPVYTRSFTAEDTSEYLPWTSLNGEVSELDPAEIVVAGTAQGCCFAVWGEYPAAGGEPVRSAAALGDPVFSGAEQFAAVLRQENGALLVSADGGQLLCEDIGSTFAAAYGGGVFATAEQTDEGGAVFLRDGKMRTLSAFSTGSEIKSLRIDGEVIFVHDGEKTAMAADISSPGSPAPLELTAAQGVVNGGYALCWGKTASGLTLTLLQLSDGRAVQADSYAKSLTAAELESLQFGGVNTMVIDGAEQSGAAYRWFDGVSVVDEFAQLGKSRSVKTLYDDRDGFTASAVVDRKITLISGNHIVK